MSELTEVPERFVFPVAELDMKSDHPKKRGQKQVRASLDNRSFSQDKVTGENDPPIQSLLKKTLKCPHHPILLCCSEGSCRIHTASDWEEYSRFLKALLPARSRDHTEHVRS